MSYSRRWGYGLSHAINSRHIARWVIVPVAVGIVMLSMPTGGAGLHAAPQPRMISLGQIKGSNSSHGSVAVLTEAYKRLGIDVSFVLLPAARSLAEANAGRLDGEVHRVGGVAATHNKLIQVTPAVNAIEAAVFAREIVPGIRRWSDLNGLKPLVPRGTVFARTWTAGMDRSVVRDYDTMFRMLQSGRATVGVAPKIDGLYYTATNGAWDVRQVGPVLERSPLFHYLHNKHADLARRVGKILASMDQSGDSEMIRQRAYQRLLERIAGNRRIPTPTGG